MGRELRICPLLTAASKSERFCVGTMCEFAVTDNGGYYKNCAILELAKNADPKNNQKSK